LVQEVKDGGSGAKEKRFWLGYDARCKKQYWGTGDVTGEEAKGGSRYVENALYEMISQSRPRTNGGQLQSLCPIAALLQKGKRVSGQDQGVGMSLKKKKSKLRMY